MKLAETKYDNSVTGCCAKLKFEDWDGREWTWKEKPFLRDHVHEILHVPLDYGAVMKRDHATIEAAAAWPTEPMWLADEVSPWGSDLYVAVDRDVPGARMVRLSGRFISKMFEGPFHNIGDWMRKTTELVASKNHTIDKLYFYYATCPQCAKKLGVNQVVVFAQLH